MLGIKPGPFQWIIKPSKPSYIFLVGNICLWTEGNPQLRIPVTFPPGSTFHTCYVWGVLPEMVWAGYPDGFLQWRENGFPCYSPSSWMYLWPRVGCAEKCPNICIWVTPVNSWCITLVFINRKTLQRCSRTVWPSPDISEYTDNQFLRVFISVDTSAVLRGLPLETI